MNLDYQSTNDLSDFNGTGEDSFVLVSELSRYIFWMRDISCTKPSWARKTIPDITSMIIKSYILQKYCVQCINDFKFLIVPIQK